MLLSKLLKAANISDIPERDTEITGLTVDSRKAEPGFLCAILAQDRETAQRYADNAAENGTAALVSEYKDIQTGLPVYYAENVRRAIALMSKSFFTPLPATLTAVTGTNGKTSTVSFVRQIWKHDGISGASFGTLGIESDVFSEYTGWTTADCVTLDKDLHKIAGLGVTHAALEASSHGLVENRLYGLKFKSAGFTNLTQDHLDYHKTMENYFAAKTLLFTDYMEENGCAVLNADIPQYAKLEEICRSRGLSIISYGKNGKDLQLLEQNLHKVGQDLTIKVFGKEYRAAMKITGSFQAWNALCALGTAIGAGLDPQKAVAALPALQNPEGRMELVGVTPQGASIFVDFAHTPDGIENALKSLRHHTENKLWIVFGCGGNRDKTKRPKMGALAKDLADKVIVTDDNPRFEDPAQIRQEILAAVPGAEEFDDRAKAIRYAMQKADDGDVVLVAGKGHEEGQIINGKVLPFNDKKEILKNL